MSYLSSYCVNKNLSYALQLFDEDNPLHKSDNKYIFTTEGHVVPIDKRFREKQWNDDFPCEEGALAEREPVNQPAPRNISNCNRIPEERRYTLPLKSIYMRQIDHMVGLF